MTKRVDARNVLDEKVARPEREVVKLADEFRIVTISVLSNVERFATGQTEAG